MLVGFLEVCGSPDFARVHPDLVKLAHGKFPLANRHELTQLAFEFVLFQITASRFFGCDYHRTPKVALTFFNYVFRSARNGNDRDLGEIYWPVCLSEQHLFFLMLENEFPPYQMRTGHGFQGSDIHSSMSQTPWLVEFIHTPSESNNLTLVGVYPGRIPATLNTATETQTGCLWLRRLEEGPWQFCNMESPY